MFLLGMQSARLCRSTRELFFKDLISGSGFAAASFTLFLYKRLNKRFLLFSVFNFASFQDLYKK